MSTFELMKNGDFHVTRSAGHGLCYICGGKKQRNDPGIFRGGAIDYEGQLDICCRCIKHAARKIGMIDDKKATDLLGIVERLEKERAEDAAHIKDLEGIIDAMRVSEERAAKKGRTKVVG